MVEVILWSVLILLNIACYVSDSIINRAVKKQIAELAEPIKIKIKLIEGGKLPQFQTEGSACLDCYARISNSITIKKGERCLIPLGFAIELPCGYEAVIRPRSGLSKKGIDEVIGTIDCDYRGEVSACLINNTKQDYTVWGGDRICQMAIREVVEATIIQAEKLTETARGEGGFGSTGIR